MGILVDLRTGSLRPSYLPLVLVDSLSSVANILNQAVFENLFLDPKFVQTLWGSFVYFDTGCFVLCVVVQP